MHYPYRSGVNVTICRLGPTIPRALYYIKPNVSSKHINARITILRNWLRGLIERPRTQKYFLSIAITLTVVSIS